MKKFILFIFCCGLLTSIATSCGSKSTTDTKTDTSTEVAKEPATKEFIKLAERTNSKLPQVLPAGIRIDKAEAVSKDEFKFYYTFTKEPTVSADDFIKSTKLALAVGLKDGKGDDLDLFRKHKMNVIYSYSTMDGKLFAEIKVTPQEYAK